MWRKSLLGCLSQRRIAVLLLSCHMIYGHPLQSLITYWALVMLITLIIIQCRVKGIPARAIWREDIVEPSDSDIVKLSDSDNTNTSSNNLHLLTWAMLSSSSNVSDCSNVFTFGKESGFSITLFDRTFLLPRLNKSCTTEGSSRNTPPFQRLIFNFFIVMCDYLFTPCRSIWTNDLTSTRCWSQWINEAKGHHVSLQGAAAEWWVEELIEAVRPRICM